MSKHFKCCYFPGIGVCISLKHARMICYRAFVPGASLDHRKVFTKSCDCDAILDIQFWAVVDVESNLKSIVAELTFPVEAVHNHDLDVFAISASDTYPKLKGYIEKCVHNCMGHHNTFIQVLKYAREILVPNIEVAIGKKIAPNDTRFYPTKRTVYTY